MVIKQLLNILQKGNYDLVFCLLPTPETHGAHKAATILTLRAIELMSNKRPVILGAGFTRTKDSVVQQPPTLHDYPLTKLSTTIGPFTLDKTKRFGFNDRLSYNIILRWLIAEHKSQGALQASDQVSELETFYYFAVNNDSKVDLVRRLFTDLSAVPFKKKSYDNAK
jgi:hypothetical protein